jgi:hypothetical protein
VPQTFVDNPFAPNIFAADAMGYFINEGTVTITLTSMAPNHVEPGGSLKKVVVGRLVMSVPAAQRLAIGLVDFLKKQGHDPVAAVTAGQTAQ